MVVAAPAETLLTLAKLGKGNGCICEAFRMTASWEDDAASTGAGAVVRKRPGKEPAGS
jgi:hypothetical protein